MPLLVVSGIALSAGLLLWWRSQRARRRTLAALVAAWGKPVERERNFDDIAAPLDLLANAAGGTRLDRRTWQDLNLDDIFRVLDRTESAIGPQALYARLHRTAGPADLAAFEEIVSVFESEPTRRQLIQLQLRRVSDAAAADVWRLTLPGILEIRASHAAFPLLATVMGAFVLLAPFWSPAALVLVAGVVLNLIVRATVGRHLWPIVVPFRQIGPLLACAERLGPLPSDNALVRTLSDDVRKLRRLRRIAAWAARGTGLHAGEPASLLFEYLNMLFFLDANAVYFGSRELARRGTELRRVMTAVGEVDAALAVTSWRVGSTGWTRPSFVAPGSPVRLHGLRHPLVDACVPNSLDLAPPFGVLITGSNMSGKTTFLRTVGVNAVLAQSIHTCLADRYEAPVFVVRSCIGRSDSVIEGRSYYLAEVEAVLGILREAGGGRSCLCLFDELFRGTNAIERLAAGEAVLRELLAGSSRGGISFVLAATHDGELVELLEDLSAPMHFSDLVGPDGLVFDYRLRAGPATTRNAIALLRLEGASPGLIERAEGTARDLDRRDRLARKPR